MTADPRFDADALAPFADAMIAAMGAPADVAAEVAGHLLEAELRGMYSHGVMRLSQYADWAAAGHFDPGGRAKRRDGVGPVIIDGGNGFGMPAMRLGVDHAIAAARKSGVAAFGVVNVGHTGRIGAFVERAAEANCFALIIGGGGRQQWRQVAPFGGAKGMLPTNPYTLGMPGGEQGPVVIDFATSAGAGGKVYAAHYAGRPLPEGLCIDRAGRPTTDPQDYIDGGALLPAAGPKGYGMALIAELLCGALLGPAMHGMNWLGMVIDLAAWRDAAPYRVAAEECLAELRATPPAPGFDRVEIPGERDRRIVAERRRDGVPLPPATIEALKVSAKTLGVDAAVLSQTA